MSAVSSIIHRNNGCIVDKDQIVASHRRIQIDLDQAASKIGPVDICHYRVSSEEDVVGTFMEARVPCYTRDDWQHVASLTRSNKKLGILSVMNNMHNISIVGEANGDVAIARDMPSGVIG